MYSQAQRLSISLPLLNTIKTYKKSWVRRDVIAGVTVAAIAIPQAMAYAQLAGAPLTAGLYAALIAMVAFALFTTTRQVTVGPDSAMAALTGATIIPLAHGNVEVAAALVAMLSILIGGACLVAVAARVGFLAEFISRPILLGYMAGLALTVIASQAPKLFGIKSSSSTTFFDTSSYLITHLGNARMGTIAFSVILLIVGIIIQHKFSRIPAALVLLVGATLVSTFLHLSSRGIPTIGTIPTGLPLPKFPGVSLSDIQNITIPAMAIMVVSYANTIATARSFAARNKEELNSNQEFVGLGVANITSGIFGGIPVAASGARTAVNHSSHSKTQVSQLFGALTIAITLLLLAPLLRNMPYCVLAVIITLAIVKLFDYPELKSIWHAWRTEAILAIVTIIGVAVLGILQGLLLAVFLAIINTIRQSSVPYDAVLGIAENGTIHDMDRPPETVTIPGIIMYRFDAPLYFANADFFRERVLSLIASAVEPVKWFLWDAETITSIDSTAGKMLDMLITELHRKHIVFAVARMKGSVREIANRSTHLSSDFESAPHYSSLGIALESFKNSQKSPSHKLLKEKTIVSRKESLKEKYSLTQTPR